MYNWNNPKRNDKKWTQPPVPGVGRQEGHLGDTDGVVLESVYTRQKNSWHVLDKLEPGLRIRLWWNG